MATVKIVFQVTKEQREQIGSIMKAKNGIATDKQIAEYIQDVFEKCLMDPDHGISTKRTYKRKKGVGANGHNKQT